MQYVCLLNDFIDADPKLRANPERSGNTEGMYN